MNRTPSLALVTKLLPLVASLALAASSGACAETEPSREASAAPATEPGSGKEEESEETAAPSKTPPIRAKVDANIAATLEKAGIDVKALPEDLSALTGDPVKLKAVMSTFSAALGVGCDGCHVKSGSSLDYAAPSPQKSVTRKMWSTFVAELQTKGGAAVYCDSCHQGKVSFLERADASALGTWMQENFVDALARKDGKPHGCANCHGEPFRGDVLKAWR